ncbi:MAG TPA: fatty acid desaturase [Polyangiales bacterium]|nr:fatty acid desaturase [Polyangiales bacterium]
MEASNVVGTHAAPIPAEIMRRLQQRSDAQGLARLGGHLALMLVAGVLYGWNLGGPPWLTLMLGLALGFTYVTMFAAMHECVHRTAFRTQWLNESAGWLAGLLSFYNATFYRYYHTWHHRFTNQPGQDPELDDGKPRDLLGYLIEMSGITWWIGKLKTHFRIALGRTDYPFLNAKTGPDVIRSVRWQLATYGAAIALSTALGQPYFLLYWLIPMVLAQPLLRAILLAEHTGCAELDAPLANTRTTYTAWPVRFLMWEMPYHAEHHRYPALPFFALAEAHRSMGPLLVHVERDGYLGMHRAFVKGLKRAA